MGTTAKKIRFVNRENKISFQFLELTFWKEKIFFLRKQRRKTTNCFSTVCLFPL